MAMLSVVILYYAQSSIFISIFLLAEPGSGIGVWSLLYAVAEVC